MSVILYTRQGCHLCDVALVILERHGLTPTLVDIDSDPGLRDRYNVCVPVVEIDGKERFRGHINEVLLKRLLVRLAPWSLIPDQSQLTYSPLTRPPCTTS